MKNKLITIGEKMILPITFIMICLSLFREDINMIPYLYMLPVRIVLLLCIIFILIVAAIKPKRPHTKAHKGKNLKETFFLNSRIWIEYIFAGYFCLYLVFQLDIISETFNYIMILIYGITLGYRIALHNVESKVIIKKSSANNKAMEKELKTLLKKLALADTRNETEAFLKKYYIEKTEYNNHWIDIQKSIFNNKRFPDMVFNNPLHLHAVTSATVFSKEEYDKLRQCLDESNTHDKYILIVEDTENPYPVRLKIPVECEWADFCTPRVTEGLSMKVFHFTEGNYYFFGDSGTWGKYVETDIYDIDIYNFSSKKLKLMFQKIYHDYPENILRMKKALQDTPYFKSIE